MPREVLESQSLEVLKERLDMALSALGDKMGCSQVGLDGFGGLRLRLSLRPAAPGGLQGRTGPSEALAIPCADRALCPCLQEAVPSPHYECYRCPVPFL